MNPSFDILTLYLTPTPFLPRGISYLYIYLPPFLYLLSKYVITTRGVIILIYATFVHQALLGAWHLMTSVFNL